VRFERGVGWFKGLVVALCCAGALVLPAAAKAGPTLVSLTFDDGTADQYQVGSMLAQDGVRGTFYINTNNVGASSFMTWAQLSALAGGGNEITGHTLDHVDLTTVTSTEATRQVCDDRQALISHGYNPIDFAYPFGATNTAVRSIVTGCGYTSARRAWGLCPVGQVVPNCPDGAGGQYPYAIAVPPPNLLMIPTAGVRAWNTLAELQQSVTRVESSGGGWTTLLFHHVCDGCDPSGGYSVSPAILSAFIDWLSTRNATGTYVRTMSDVVTDRTPPTSSIACNGAACAAWYTGPVSVSLSASDTGTAVTAIRYTTDGSTPTTASALYSGPFSVSSTATVKFRAWDMAGNVEAAKSQLIQVDPSAPTSSIACGGAACSSGWYTSPISVSLSATDTGSGVAAIRYTTDGSTPTTASPLYSGPFSVSSTTTVKYRAWDVAGNAEATKSQVIQVDSSSPDSSIGCNGSSCSGWYTSAVSVSLSATDTGSGVAAIRYTTDGTDPTAASPLYSGPVSVSSTTTVKYRAWDVAGNVEATNSQLIQLDSADPTSSIACNGSACSSGTYTSAVSVSLSATDGGGSGVAAIRYTTDGSDPTTSSPLYSGPFSVSSTTTVKYRAWDVAGNVEATNSQLIQVDTTPADTTPPTSSIACGGAACSSGWYTSAVSVSLSATDGGGSGVAAIRYTTDGSDPTTSSPLYSGPFSVSSTTTVKYRAWDVAGNAEATKSQLIRVDSTAPTSSISCNGSACTSNWYSPPVNASLLATDLGSGVAAIRYTTDGTDPTSASPLYTGSLSVAVTTTIKFRAWDVAGNVEAVRTQLIRVDTFPPTVAITSPANGTTVTGTIKIVAAPTDAETGVASVRFNVDGVLLGTVTSSPWQIPWNTKKSTSGQHVLTAVATDRAGNTKTSAPITVTVR
jgi:peptidoglycan/xylan/chitin deacetylase (PgdA/CDA1 family)